VRRGPQFQSRKPTALSSISTTASKTSPAALNNPLYHYGHRDVVRSFIIFDR